MSCWLSASLSLNLSVRMSKSISATIRASSTAPSSFLCYLRDDLLATVTTNFTCNIFQFLSHSKTKLPIALRGALRPTKHAEYFIFWEFQELFFLSFSPPTSPACATSSPPSQFFHSFLLFCVSRARIKIVFVCGSACWFRLLSEMWNAKWEMENASRGQEEDGEERREGEQKERKNLLRVLL